MPPLWWWVLEGGTKLSNCELLGRGRPADRINAALWWKPFAAATSMGVLPSAFFTYGSAPLQGWATRAGQGLGPGELCMLRGRPAGMLHAAGLVDQAERQSAPPCWPRRRAQWCGTVCCVARQPTQTRARPYPPAPLQQRCHRMPRAVLRRGVQRRPPQLGHRIHVCPRLDQNLRQAAGGRRLGAHRRE